MLVFCVVFLDKARQIIGHEDVALLIYGNAFRFFECSFVSLSGAEFSNELAITGKYLDILFEGVGGQNIAVGVKIEILNKLKLSIGGALSAPGGDKFDILGCL